MAVPNGASDNTLRNEFFVCFAHLKLFLHGTFPKVSTHGYVISIPEQKNFIQKIA